MDDSNLEEYLTLVLDMTLGLGIARQIKSLQDGQSPSTEYRSELTSRFLYYNANQRFKDLLS